MKQLVLASIVILYAVPAQAGFFSSIFGKDYSQPGPQELERDADFCRHLIKVSSSEGYRKTLVSGLSYGIVGTFAQAALDNGQTFSSIIRNFFSDKPSMQQLETASTVITMLEGRVPNRRSLNDLIATQRSTAELVEASKHAFRSVIALGIVDCAAQGITTYQAHNTRNFIRENLPSKYTGEETARLARWQGYTQEVKEHFCQTLRCKKEMDSLAAFLKKTNQKNK